MLAHKASEEGVACVEKIVLGFGHVNYDTVPNIVYTDPEIAWVGRTERELEEAGIPFKKGTYNFKGNGRAMTIGSANGLVKILAFWGEEAVIKLVLDSKLDLAIFAVPDRPEMRLDSKESISVCISKWRKIHPETVPVEAKACSNYLNGYLARKDANKRGFDDAILLGTDGFLAEAPTSSVFIIKDGILKTPPLGRVLSSITRKSVLEIALYLDIDISQEALFPEDLFDEDEIFLSFTGVKVQAVKRLEDKKKEAPGPVTKRLMDQMDKILDFQDEHFKEWMQQL